MMHWLTSRFWSAPLAVGLLLCALSSGLPVLVVARVDSGDSRQVAGDRGGVATPHRGGLSGSGVRPGSGVTSASPVGRWPPGQAEQARRGPVEAAGLARRVDATDAVLGEFTARHPDWWVAADPLTGSIERGFGPGIPVPGDDPVEVVRAWLQQAAPLTAVPFDELVLQALPGATQPGRVRWIDISQRHAGLRVLEAGMTVAVRDGHIVYIAGRSLATVATDVRPALTAAAALASLTRRLAAGSLESLKVPELAYAPEASGSGAARRLRHRLVWMMMVVPSGRHAIEAHHAWIDAHTGDLVEFFPDALHSEAGRASSATAACRADPRHRTGVVSGGVRPNRADDPEEVRVFPSVAVLEDGTFKSTDLNGAFTYAGGDAWSTLSGPDFDMTCQVCAEQPRAVADGGGRIAFGTGGESAGFPVTTNGTSTPADRTTFYHLSQMRQLLEKWDVAAFPEILAEVNIAASCNALSNRYLVQFFQAGDGCRNTGEIRDVIGHELGHNWDRFDGIDITNLVRTDLSEWKADMLALLMGGDACIGESFFENPGVWKTEACSGVRDIDEKAAGRRDHPLTPAACDTCATLTLASNNCTANTPHCNGEITGQAIWHLKQNLLTGRDYVSGVVLAGDNPALSRLQVQHLLEKWLLRGGPPIKNWKPDKPGISPYEAITVEDDDDLDLSNGVPHGAYINAAFQHHEVAESALIGDSANCAAPTDPIVSAQVELHPLTGRPRVRIDWTGSAAAAAGVYRNWRTGDAFLPVAGLPAAAPVFDENVGVGETLHYLVVATSRDGCGMVSPGHNIVTVTIDRPDVRVERATVSEATGDGDGVIEPGEIARVEFSLVEVGGLGGATGLTATVASQDPFVLVPERVPGRGRRLARTRTPIRSRHRTRAVENTIAFDGLPAGGRSTSDDALFVGVAPDTACPGLLTVPVSITSTQGCWVDSISISLAGGSCEARGGGHVRPLEDSLLAVGDSGDGDGIVDNCEVTTFTYRLGNVGDEPSGPVIATVTSLTPEVQVVSGEIFATGNMDPGEERLVSFSVNTAGLNGPGPVSFALTAASAGNIGPAVLDVTVNAEEDDTIFGALTFDFESGLQGWAAEGFALSTTRAASGAQSVHAGAVNQNWLCQHLTSPVVRLDPEVLPELQLQAWVDIEPVSDRWYDRANVHIIDVKTGAHHVVTPSSGLAYTAVGGLRGNLCHVDQQVGWAGEVKLFAPAVFDLSAWAGREVRIEINYASDAGLDLEGVYIDDITVLGAALVPPDGQSDACTASGAPAP